MARKQIKYDNFITADTESNPDGSLYLISSHDTLSGESKLFYDLTSFYNYLDSLGNVTVYIHNFGKWDSFFLFTEEVMKKYEAYKVISKGSNLMKVTLMRKTKRTRNYITFEDTLQRTMISLKAFADSIGEPYTELPDYDIHREPMKPETWEDRELIEEYAIKDVVILHKLIEQYRKVYKTFDKSMSAGSMVWSEVVQEFSPSPRFQLKDFRKEFKALPLAYDNMIRKSYMGGITTPFWHAGIVLDRPKLKELYPWFKNPVIYGDDISSAYAWAQIKNVPKGVYDVLKEDARSYIYRNIHTRNKIIFVTIKYSYTRAKFPLIPKLHMEESIKYDVELNMDYHTYNEKSNYMETMLKGSSGIAAVSTLDLRIAEEEQVYENFKYEIIPFLGSEGVYGLQFPMRVSKEIKHVTEKYYKLKNDAPNKALRTAYKSPLVNIYGKTAERYYEDNKEVDLITREVTTTPREKVGIPKYANVAVAAAITSYVHHSLYFKAKEVGFENILYCDTDSMFYVGEEGNLKPQVEDLGVWNNEVYNPDRALFICPKKYIIEDKGSRLKWASAGLMRTDTSFNIDNWMSGKRLYKQKVKKPIKNGIKLVLKDIDVYDSWNDTDQYIYSHWNVFK